MAQPVDCPFCGYSISTPYAIQLHIEERHTENSPFAIAESSAPPVSPPPSASASSSSRSSEEQPSDDDNPWIKCTRPDCGEYISVADLDEHYRFHADLESLREEDLSPRKGGKQSRFREEPRQDDETRASPRRPRERPKSQSTTSSRTSGNPTSGNRSILDWISGGGSTTSRPQQHRSTRTHTPRTPGRLGRSDLGPHAWEERMPTRVRQILLDGPELTRRIRRDGSYSREIYAANETRGLIPVLSELCNTNGTAAAYLCDPAVRHIVKFHADGHFCGYWNIQMLLTYLNASRPHSNGTERRVPNIIGIQEDIERAWDNGICAHARLQTGGITNTRKWIGTTEALAYFTQIGVDMECVSFDSPRSLLDHVEAYFMSAVDLPGTQHRGRSHITPLPPIYFQRPGHSTTIVGLERKANGARSLLVFDPSHATTAAMGRWLAGRHVFASAENILKAYRRGAPELSRYDEFEICVPKTQSVSPVVGEVWDAKSQSGRRLR